MSPRVVRIIVIVGVGLVATGFALAVATQRMYLAPRDARLAEIADLEQQISGVRAVVDRRPAGRREHDAFVARTLGGSLETVDHELRTRLNRIVEAVGLNNPSVNTGRSTKRPSPARAAFRRSGPWKELRDMLDFVELDATIVGEGTFAQVVELADRIDAEPWMKRVNAIRFDPRDNGERMSIRLQLTTLFVPGAAPEETPAASYDRARLARYEVLVEQNPFRLPPPPAPPAVVETPEPAPAPAQPDPPAFPWPDWSVTGVTELGGMSEVWVRRRSTGERRILTPGDEIGPATLVSVDGDEAVFDHDGTRFRVRVGGSLKHEADGSKR